MAMMGLMTVSAQQKVESDAQTAINNIMTRTSVRKYTNEPVSKADIETMLRAGMAAPHSRQQAALAFCGSYR